MVKIVGHKEAGFGLQIYKDLGQKVLLVYHKFVSIYLFFKKSIDTAT